MRQFILLVCVFMFCQPLQASQKRKVLFIGIDGCRSDALQQANAPNLHALHDSPSSLATYDAWHLGITVSGPSWSTMMTGVWWDKHGVSGNSYTGSNFNQYPYLTTLAKSVMPNLYCAEVCEWPPLIDDVYNDHFNLQIHTPDGQGPTTCAVATPVLLNDSVDFAFVYFDQVDLTGHSSGFDPNNPAYIHAIENVDSCVGVLLNVLHSRPNYANEDWLVLIMTDHGGIGKGHGGNSNEERHIWWIANGADIQHVALSGTDPGTYNQYIIGSFVASGVDTTLMRQTPVHPDIAVTALHHLIYDSGINPMQQLAWNLDGKSWLGTAAGINEEKKVADNVYVYPNPFHGQTGLGYTLLKKCVVKIDAVDLSGRVVYSIFNGVREPGSYKDMLDLEKPSLPQGAYMLRLDCGGTVTYKKVLDLDSER